MPNVYRLKEMSRILAVEPEELKALAVASGEFAGIEPGLLDGRRFSEEEFAALAGRVAARRAPAPAGPAPAVSASPAPVDPVPALRENLESMKVDLVRAIYAGDRRNDALLGDLRRSVRRAEESGEIALKEAVGRLALHFDEVCAKLNRQSKALDEVSRTIRGLENAVKRLENLAEARDRREAAALRAAEPAEKKGEPLAWGERLVYEFFMPWKLRGRV